MSTWLEELDLEFERARLARTKNNEGQARVCARRAAGIAIRESLVRRGVPSPSKSAYDLLNQAKSGAQLPPEMELIVEHLTVRVNEDFRLPIDADLVAEARTLCRWLLPEWKK